MIPFPQPIVDILADNAERSVLEDFCRRFSISRNRLAGESDYERWLSAFRWAEIKSVSSAAVLEFYRAQQFPLPADLINNEAAAAQTGGGVEFFVSYNRKDAISARKLALQLIQKHGIKVFFDELSIHPGDAWIKNLAEAVESCNSAGICVGAHGMGPWQTKEFHELLAAGANDGKAIVPVLFEGSPEPGHLPIFLRSLNVVDLRQDWNAGVKRIADQVYATRSFSGSAAPLV